MGLADLLLYIRFGCSFNSQRISAWPSSQLMLREQSKAEQKLRQIQNEHAYILLFTVGHGQCASSCCAGPSNLRQAVEQPDFCSASQVTSHQSCQTFAQTNQQPTDYQHHIAHEEPIHACLAGYDKEIYDLMDEIKEERGTQLKVNFYRFVNCKLYLIGTFVTDFKVLEDKMQKYHHYFCFNEKYLEKYNNDEHCWYLRKLIMIPSLKTKGFEKLDLPTLDENQQGSNEKDNYEFNSKDNINMPKIVINCKSEHEYKKEPNMVYPNYSRPKCLEVNLPQEKEMTFPPMLVDLFMNRNQRIQNVCLNKNMLQFLAQKEEKKKYIDNESYMHTCDHIRPENNGDFHSQGKNQECGQAIQRCIQLSDLNKSVNNNEIQLQGKYGNTMQKYDQVNIDNYMCDMRKQYPYKEYWNYVCDTATKKKAKQIENCAETFNKNVVYDNILEKIYNFNTDNGNAEFQRSIPTLDHVNVKESSKVAKNLANYYNANELINKKKLSNTNKIAEIIDYKENDPQHQKAFVDLCNFNKGITKIQNPVKDGKYDTYNYVNPSCLVPNDNARIYEEMPTNFELYINPHENTNTEGISENCSKIYMENIKPTQYHDITSSYKLHDPTLNNFVFPFKYALKYSWLRKYGVPFAFFEKILLNLINRETVSLKKQEEISKYLPVQRKNNFKTMPYKLNSKSDLKTIVCNYVAPIHTDLEFRKMNDFPSNYVTVVASKPINASFRNSELNEPYLSSDNLKGSFDEYQDVPKLNTDKTPTVRKSSNKESLVDEILCTKCNLSNQMSEYNHKHAENYREIKPCVNMNHDIQRKFNTYQAPLTINIDSNTTNYDMKVTNYFKTPQDLYKILNSDSSFSNSNFDSNLKVANVKSNVLLLEPENETSGLKVCMESPLIKEISQKNLDLVPTSCNIENVQNIDILAFEPQYNNNCYKKYLSMYHLGDNIDSKQIFHSTYPYVEDNNQKLPTSNTHINKHIQKYISSKPEQIMQLIDKKISKNVPTNTVNLNHLKNPQKNHNDYISYTGPDAKKLKIVNPVEYTSFATVDDVKFKPNLKSLELNYKKSNTIDNNDRSFYSEQKYTSTGNIFAVNKVKAQVPTVDVVAPSIINKNADINYQIEPKINVKSSYYQNFPVIEDLVGQPSKAPYFMRNNDLPVTKNNHDKPQSELDITYSQYPVNNHQYKTHVHYDDLKAFDQSGNGIDIFNVVDPDMGNNIYDKQSNTKFASCDYKHYLPSVANLDNSFDNRNEMKIKENETKQIISKQAYKTTNLDMYPSNNVLDVYQAPIYENGNLEPSLLQPLYRDFLIKPTGIVSESEKDTNAEQIGLVPNINKNQHIKQQKITLALDTNHKSISEPKIYSEMNWKQTLSDIKPVVSRKIIDNNVSIKNDNNNMLMPDSNELISNSPFSYTAILNKPSSQKKYNYNEMTTKSENILIPEHQKFESQKPCETSKQFKFNTFLLNLAKDKCLRPEYIPNDPYAPNIMEVNPEFNTFATNSVRTKGVTSEHCTVMQNFPCSNSVNPIYDTFESNLQNLKSVNLHSQKVLTNLLHQKSVNAEYNTVMPNLPNLRSVIPKYSEDKSSLECLTSVSPEYGTVVLTLPYKKNRFPEYYTVISNSPCSKSASLKFDKVWSNLVYPKNPNQKYNKAVTHVQIPKTVSPKSETVVTNLLPLKSTSLDYETVAPILLRLKSTFTEHDTVRTILPFSKRIGPEYETLISNSASQKYGSPEYYRVMLNSPSSRSTSTDFDTLMSNLRYPDNVSPEYETVVANLPQIRLNKIKSPEHYTVLLNSAYAKTASSQFNTDMSNLSHPKNASVECKNSVSNLPFPKDTNPKYETVVSNLPHSKSASSKYHTVISNSLCPKSTGSEFNTIMSNSPHPKNTSTQYKKVVSNLSYSKIVSPEVEKVVPNLLSKKNESPEYYTVISNSPYAKSSNSEFDTVMPNLPFLKTVIPEYETVDPDSSRLNIANTEYHTVTSTLPCLKSASSGYDTLLPNLLRPKSASIEYDTIMSILPYPGKVNPEYERDVPNMPRSKSKSRVYDRVMSVLVGPKSVGPEYKTKSHPEKKIDQSNMPCSKKTSIEYDTVMSDLHCPNSEGLEYETVVTNLPRVKSASTEYYSGISNSLYPKGASSEFDTVLANLPCIKNANPEYKKFVSNLPYSKSESPKVETFVPNLARIKSESSKYRTAMSDLPYAKSSSPEFDTIMLNLPYPKNASLEYKKVVSNLPFSKSLHPDYEKFVPNFPRLKSAIMSVLPCSKSEGLEHETFVPNSPYLKSTFAEYDTVMSILPSPKTVDLKYETSGLNLPCLKTGHREYYTSMSNSSCPNSASSEFDTIWAKLPYPKNFSPEYKKVVSNLPYPKNVHPDYEKFVPNFPRLKSATTEYDSIMSVLPCPKSESLECETFVPNSPSVKSVSTQYYSGMSNLPCLKSARSEFDTVLAYLPYPKNVNPELKKFVSTLPYLKSVSPKDETVVKNLAHLKGESPEYHTVVSNSPYTKSSFDTVKSNMPYPQNVSPEYKKGVPNLPHLKSTSIKYDTVMSVLPGPKSEGLEYETVVPNSPRLKSTEYYTGMSNLASPNSASSELNTVLTNLPYPKNASPKYKMFLSNMPFPKSKSPKYETVVPNFPLLKSTSLKYVKTMSILPYPKNASLVTPSFPRLKSESPDNKYDMIVSNLPLQESVSPEHYTALSNPLSPKSLYLELEKVSLNLPYLKNASPEYKTAVSNLQIPKKGSPEYDMTLLKPCSKSVSLEYETVVPNLPYLQSANLEYQTFLSNLPSLKTLGTKYDSVMSNLPLNILNPEDGVSILPSSKSESSKYQMFVSKLASSKGKSPEYDRVMSNAQYVNNLNPEYHTVSSNLPYQKRTSPDCNMVMSNLQCSKNVNLDYHTVRKKKPPPKSISPKNNADISNLPYPKSVSLELDTFMSKLPCQNNVNPEYHSVLSNVPYDVTEFKVSEYRVPFDTQIKQPTDINQGFFQLAEKIKTNLQQCIRSSDNFKCKMYNCPKEITIPLGEIGVAKYNANVIDSNTFTIKTEDPTIKLKAWYSKIKVVKAKLAIETEEKSVLNFMPIVSDHKKIKPDLVTKIAKDIVTRIYGEPIIIKGVYSMYKPFAIVCDSNRISMNENRFNILWPTFCECGCGKCGCKCFWNYSWNPNCLFNCKCNCS